MTRGEISYRIQTITDSVQRCTVNIGEWMVVHKNRCFIGRTFLERGPQQLMLFLRA